MLIPSEMCIPSPAKQHADSPKRALGQMRNAPGDAFNPGRPCQQLHHIGAVKPILLIGREKRLALCMCAGRVRDAWIDAQKLIGIGNWEARKLRASSLQRLSAEKFAQPIRLSRKV